MNLLPTDVQLKIGEYLTIQEIYSTQYILKSNAIQHLKFPLTFPIRSFDNVTFCKWLFRWRHYLSNIKSISINYLNREYKAATFEMLGLIHIKRMEKLDITNILSLFDPMSPRRLLAFKSFFSKLHSVNNVYVDARLMQFCSHFQNAKFTTFVTIGTCTIFYENHSEQDTRETSLAWLNNFDHHVNIKCWCFQSHGICKTLERIPPEKMNQVTISHHHKRIY